MGFWITLLISLAITIVGELLRPKPKMEERRPSSLGDFRFPTIDESRAIPVIFGRVKQSGPNVVWWGDLTAVPIKKKVKTGLFSSKKVIQGYKYYLGVQCVIGWGDSSLTFIGIEFEDKPVTLTALTNGADVVTFTMNSPTLLSAEDPKNGVSGPVKIYKGTFNQVQNDYLAGQWGETTISAYRGVCHAVFEHCYLGNNDSVPDVSFIVQRNPNPLGLTGGKQIINGMDANPACAVYEILTNTFWGASIPAASIDFDSFLTVAETLHGENLGISMMIDSASTAEKLISEILRHVDGVLYMEPTNGKWTLALARADYDIEDLLHVNEANISPDSFSYSRGSWDETKNTVKLTYIDASQKYTERMVQHQNLANIAARGGQIDMESIDFNGLSNAASANVVAARVMKTISTPLARLEVELNRTLMGLRPGSVFRFSWAALGIVQQVYRVVDIDRGSTDSMTQRIVAVEDIFAISAVSYEVPPTGGWVDPFAPPTAMPREGIFELPYGITNSSYRFVGTVGSPSKGIDTGYHVWQDPAGGSAYVETGTAYFTPNGLLTSDYAKNSTANFIINSGVLLATIDTPTSAEIAAGDSLARIKSIAGEEIIAWSTLVDNGNGTWTVGGVLRGQYDTPPLAHPSGAEVWFVSDGLGLLQDQPYSTNASVSAKLTPYNRSGELLLADATQRTLTLADRALRPYPPANFRFNGVYYSTVIAGELTVAWAHRDRLTQALSTVAQTAADQGPEAGVTYTLKLYDETNTLRRTETALAVTTYTWSTEAEDCGLYSQVGDIYTVALLHFDGPNASTVLKDVTGKAWSASGNAQISTAQSKFGGSSLLLDGAGDYEIAADSANWYFGSGDFCIEAWVRVPVAGGSDRTICSQYNATGEQRSWIVRVGTDGIPYISVYPTGVAAGAYAAYAASSVVADTWHHVACVRLGASLTVYLDGVGGTPYNVGTASFFDSNYSLLIGALNSGGVTQFFNGYIDELRISKGVARYTANFTPPTAEFDVISTAADLVKDRCIYYFSLDETTGTTVKDWELNTALDLTATGATLAQPTIRGGGSRSILIDSTDRLVSSIRPAEMMDALSYSFSAWVYITAWSASNNTMYMAGQPTVETSTENIRGTLYIDASRKLVHLHEYGSGTNQTVSAAAMSALSLNTPYLIGFTKDATTKTTKFYVDGALVDTVAYVNEATGGTGSTCRLILGAGATAGDATTVVNGRMQDALLTNDLLTDADHSWLYNGGTGRGRLDVLGVDSRLNTSIRAELFSVRDGLESKHLDHTAPRP